VIKFGIITPTFNRPELLKRCIQSVENQTYSNWVHVIIDDSTTHETENLRLGSDKLVYIKNEVNSGVGISRNKGIDYLCSQEIDYIIFLDDDDYFDINCLSKANEYIKKNINYQWFVSRRVFHNTNKSLTELYIVKDSYNYLKDSLIGKCIRRDTTHILSLKILADTRIRFPEHIRGGGEWRFFAKLSEYIDFSFFEGGVTFTELQMQGLTANNINNKLFIATERAALVIYLHERAKFKLKQIEYGASVVKHFIKLQRYDLLNEFYQDFINQKNPIIKVLFNLEIFLLKRKYS